MASGYKDTADGADFPINLLDQGDWRADIFNYLKDPARGAPKKTCYKAMKYVLIGTTCSTGLWKGYCLSAWGRLNPIGSYMKSMKVRVVLINQLTR
jgi:hypothetical protein